MLGANDDVTGAGLYSTLLVPSFTPLVFDSSRALLALQVFDVSPAISPSATLAEVIVHLRIRWKRIATIASWIQEMAKLCELFGEQVPRLVGHQPDEVSPAGSCLVAR
jgi:hypothetical protein